MGWKSAVRRGVFGLLAFAGVVLGSFTAQAAEKGYDPFHAISPWSPEAAFVAGRVGGLRDMIHGVMSSDMLQEMAKAEADIPLGEMAAWLESFPVESFAFASGFNRGVLHMQVAAAMAPAHRPMLDRLAKGALISEDLQWWQGIMLPLGEKVIIEEGVTLYEIQPGHDVPLKLFVGAKDNLLLLGLRTGDVLASMAALRDGTQRFAPERQFSGSDFFMFQDNGFIQLALLAADMPRLLNAAVKGEISLGNRGNLLELGVYSTIPQAFFTPKQLAGFRPVTSAPQLVGGGRTIFAAAGALNYDYLLESLHEYGDEEIEEGLNQTLMMAGAFGVTEADVRDLLGGDFQVILGGKASLQSAPLPGFYIVFNGTGEAAKRVADVLAKQMQENGLPLENTAVAGWDMVLGTQLPGTLTVGVKGASLLVGFLDAKSMAEAQQPAEALRATMNRKDGYGYLFFDCEAFLDAAFRFIQGGDIWGQIMGSDFTEAVDSLFEAWPVLAGLKHIQIDAPSLDKGVFQMETLAPSQKVQEVWKKLQAEWEQKRPVNQLKPAGGAEQEAPFKDIELDQVNPEPTPTN